MKLILLIVSSLLGGCSLVSVSGATSTQRFLNVGPVTVTIDQPARAIVTSTYGVGATNIQGTTNIGYLDQEVVVIPSSADCQLILIVKNHQELEKAKQILGNALNQACTNEKETPR